MQSRFTNGQCVYCGKEVNFADGPHNCEAKIDARVQQIKHMKPIHPLGALVSQHTLDHIQTICDLSGEEPEVIIRQALLHGLPQVEKMYTYNSPGVGQMSNAMRALIPSCGHGPGGDCF